MSPALLAATALALGGTVAGAPLPLTLSVADRTWRLDEVDKPTGQGLTLAAVATHVGAADRLLFLTAPAGPGAGDADAFARRVTAAFTDFTASPARGRNATRAGFTGRDLRFELASPQGAMDCELFVFADAGSRWGILYARPRGAPDAAEAAFGLLLRNIAPPAGGYTLKPLRVHNSPLTTFPISIRIRWAPGGTRVAGIAITEVLEQSEAEQAGIRAGDEIVAIDGRPVGDFTGGVGRDDALGRIFLNRQAGDTVTLELRSGETQKTFAVTLHAAWGQHSPFPSQFHGH